MAVTIIKRPFEFVPAHNDIEFEASSSQTAQPNFSFYVTVTIGSTVLVYSIPPAPGTGYCYFNLRAVAEKYVKNYYPFGVDGWTQCTDGIQKFIVNIGEFYGTTPVVYTGTGINIYAWNAALTREERGQYLPANYMTVSASTEVKILNNFDDEIKTKLNKDVVVFMLQDAVQIDKLKIITYDAAGSPINAYDLDNPIATSTTAGKYICVNVGMASLEQLLIDSPGDFTTLVSPVASSAPIFNSDPDYYEITFYTASETRANTIRIRLDGCCQRFFNTPVFYLNRFGAWDSINLCGKHRKSRELSRTHYRALSQTFEPSYTNSTQTTNTLASSPLGLNKKTLSNSYVQNQTLVSQPLTDFEILAMADSASSPDTIVQYDYDDYKVFSNNVARYEFKTNVIDKITTIELSLNEDTERRQFSSE